MRWYAIYRVGRYNEVWVSRHATRTAASLALRGCRERDPVGTYYLYRLNHKTGGRQRVS